MISTVAALLLARLGAGALLAAGLMHRFHAVPEAFLRFTLKGAAGLLALSALVGWGRPDALVQAALAIAALLLLRAATSPRLGPLMAALGAAGALLASALGGSGAIAAAGAMSGVFLLGAVSATMLLGHWYLVDTSLSIRPLAIGGRLVELAAWARVGVAALALLTGGYAALRIASPEDLIYSTSALFFSFRAVTGLAAPIALAFLIRRTIRIRSTQSATGLLYVALILVLFGELTAVFLETVTGGALV